MNSFCPERQQYRPVQNGTEIGKRYGRIKTDRHLEVFIRELIEVEGRIVPCRYRIFERLKSIIALGVRGVRGGQDRGVSQILLVN